MAAETSPPTKLCKNILIGVTGSVASVKLSRLVEELLLLQPKVRLVSYKDNLYSNNKLHRLMVFDLTTTLIFVCCKLLEDLPILVVVSAKYSGYCNRSFYSFL